MVVANNNRDHPPLPTLQRLSLTTKTALATLATFVVVIWSLAFLAGSLLRQDTERLVGEQQFSALKLVAESADRAIAERIDALTIGSAIYQTQMSTRSADLQTLLANRPVLVNLFNRGVFVTDEKGLAVASVPASAGRLGINYADRPYVQSVLREGKPVVSEPLVGRATQAPVFATTVAIKDANGRVVGTMTGATDLLMPNFLDVVSRNRVGRTGGYLLIDRASRQIISATDRSRVMEKLPGVGAVPEIDPYFAGEEGTKC